ncbi:hypothetical protein GPUN_0674 [Glaciecola punicea ACAM 611]|uniref:Uncharacterized protein n=1 Tax=Glaciecola punicea ACAM 611 TaxID=1121923 RepID=H5T937_9ALTE|nr:hypothetical protein GPUN_0674 [Glaciecola punicea ACAM 611]
MKKASLFTEHSIVNYSVSEHLNAEITMLCEVCAMKLRI